MISSRPWVSRLLVRSPSPLAMLAIADTTSSSGRVMLRAMRMTSKAMMRAMANPIAEARMAWARNSACMSSM
ncbi:hypothetical protein D9M73_257510 [compost metagenome]